VRSDTRDFVARGIAAALFALMSVNLLGDFLRTRHLTGLLLVVSESLVVVLTLFRRRTSTSDHSVAAGAATALSYAAPALVRSTTLVPIAPDAVTASLSAVGVLVVIVAKASLGRSFGIAPANRGIVAGGAYNVVRHPIYAGYIVTHLGFALAHPSAWNIAALIVADGALVARALFEERFLRQDERYREYCHHVGWHLVPGVF
jgi:protein-S-isoprenylcysteine O-methyltransferase Ste14